MKFARNFSVIFAATLLSGSIMSTSAVARDGQWRADLVTRKGHSNCIPKFSVSFRIDDGIIKGELLQEGISWVYHGVEIDKTLSIIAISSGGEYKFSLEGEMDGDSGAGFWRNSLGCEGSVTYNRVGN